MELASVPEIIVTVFAKTSPKRSFSITEYERFGRVFTKTRVYKFGHIKALNSSAEEFRAFVIGRECVKKGRQEQEGDSNIVFNNLMAINREISFFCTAKPLLKSVRAHRN